MVFGLGLSWIFHSLVAMATMSLVDYSKYVYTLDETDPKNIKLFAGSTSRGCASTSTTDVCNSCAQGDAIEATRVCNTKQINSNLKFRVTINSDKADLFSGGNSVYVKFNEKEITPSFDANQFAVGRNIDVYFTWGLLCNAATDGDTNCTSSFAPKNLFVGIGSSFSSLSESVKFTISYRYVRTSAFQSFSSTCAGSRTFESFCYFYVFPGDEKAYIQSTFNAAGGGVAMNLSGSSVSDTADISGQRNSAMRVYYTAGGRYADIKTNSSYIDFKFDGSSLSESRISGLTNGTQYVFLTANVDQGGNVSFFTNPQDGNLCAATDGKCYGPPYKDDNNRLTQTVVPNKVVGLLDSEKCFIATAAYGSPVDLRVQEFRHFRDDFLLTSGPGRFLVKIYYRVSPPIAEWISERPWRMQVARIVLWPLSKLVIFMNSVHGLVHL